MVVPFPGGTALCSWARHFTVIKQIMIFLQCSKALVNPSTQTKRRFAPSFKYWCMITVLQFAIGRMPHVLCTLIVVLRAGLTISGETVIVIHSVKRLAIVVWIMTRGEFFVCDCFLWVAFVLDKNKATLT